VAGISGIRTERSDLLENAVTEAILDMKLGLAIVPLRRGTPANTLMKNRSLFC
jgi:hypothetical protein